MMWLTRRRPNYGLDGPPVLRNLLAAAIGMLAYAGGLEIMGTPYPAGLPLRDIAMALGVNFLLIAGGLVWYSKVRKLRRRERLLDLIPWRGDEAVLDVGCGRGLLVVGAARRLTTGHAVGIDRWQRRDLSGNRPDAALENARLEGVSDRVDIRDGDARQLPFADASFDVILSALVLHNIYDGKQRRQAVREIARVLKPGGRVVLVDVAHTAEYARVLRQCGLSDAARSGSGPLAPLVRFLTWGTVQPGRVTASRPMGSRALAA